MSTRLTARDIQNQRFRRRLRGWDREQVAMFLSSVSDEVERLNLENGKLLERIGQLERQSSEYRAREKTLQQTLITAQKMTEDVKDKARAQAGLILEEARLKSERMIQEGQDLLTQIELEISRRRMERDLFEKRLRLTIEEHLRLLEQRAQSDGKPREVERLHVIHSRQSEAG